VCYEIRGTDFLVRQFRMSVNIPADTGDLVLPAYDGFCQVHEGLQKKIATRLPLGRRLAGIRRRGGPNGGSARFHMGLDHGVECRSRVLVTGIDIATDGPGVRMKDVFADAA